MVISNGPFLLPRPCYPMRLPVVLDAQTTAPVAFLRRAVSALFVSEIRRGLERTYWKLEMKGLNVRYMLFTIVGVKKISSSCFATASVFCLKSHPKTGTRER